MWQMMTAPHEWMRQTFARPTQVKESLSVTALMFSDQIPFWVKIVPDRQLYGAGEVRGKNKPGDKAHVAPMSQKFEAENEAPTEAGRQGQTRGQGVSEQDKYRVTLEVTQVVENYFSSSEEPKSRVLPSALILIGSHGRLSNLSDEGTFLKDLGNLKLMHCCRAFA